VGYSEGEPAKARHADGTAAAHDGARVAARQAAWLHGYGVASGMVAEVWRWCGKHGRLGLGSDEGGGVRMKKKKKDLMKRLKTGLRSAFYGVIGCAVRLTGRAAEASGQSPVSSWRDRTCLVRADRTRTESGQSPPGKPSRMTGRAGGVQDRTQWSQRRVRSEVHENCLRLDRTRWW
jgi:hypothetical protein